MSLVNAIPPARGNQAGVAVLICAMSGLLWPNIGTSADTALQELLQDCAAVRSAEARLACFEALATPPPDGDRPDSQVPARTAMPAAAESSAPPAQVVPEPDRNIPQQTAAPDIDDFGLENQEQAPPQSTAADTVDSEIRHFTVESARFNQFTGWTIEFDNGQVWRQVGSQPYDIREGETYSIQRGSFNSHVLGNADNNRKIRVTRQQ